MDKNRIPRTPRGKENGLGGHMPSLCGINIYIWLKIEYQEPHEAEKTVWEGLYHLSVE